MRPALLFAIVLALPTTAAAQQAGTQQPGTARDLDEPRVRFGVDVGAGVGVAEERAGTVAEAAFALHAALGVRIGGQIDATWAAYYEARGEVAGVVGCNGDVCGALLPGAMHVSSALVEATFLDGLPIAIGPSLAWGVMQSHGKASWGGGGVARIGWTFGGHGRGTRQGLSLSLRLSVVYLGPNEELHVPPRGTPVVVTVSEGGYVASIAMAVGWDTF